MSYLLASGCSWTDANFKSDILPDYDCSFPKWPELLGKQLGISEVVNVGKSGASNDSMFNKCYDQIAKRKPKLVCILISDWSRHSIFNYTLNIYDLLATDYVVSTKQLPKSLDYWRDWLDVEKSALAMSKKLWTEDLFVKDIVNNTLREIWLFQTFCEHHNIDYIIMSGLEPVIIYHLTLLDKYSAVDRGITELSSYIKQTLKSPYANKLNEKNLLGWPIFEEIGGYSVWTNFVNRQPNTVFVDDKLDSHPNALGHKVISELFYKGYQDIYGKIS